MVFGVDDFVGFGGVVVVVEDFDGGGFVDLVFGGNGFVGGGLGEGAFVDVVACGSGFGEVVEF